MSAECLPLKAIHHVELLVGNAKQAAYFYRHAFGFSQLAYAGPETGIKDQASYAPLAERSHGGSTAAARRRRA
jgi:4-hydroxyphenylpyruvate dioxygenase